MDHGAAGAGAAEAAADAARPAATVTEAPKPCRAVTKPGKESATRSAPSITVLPSATSPATAKSLAIYAAAAEHARARGIIIADTKFEFGTPLAGGEGGGAGGGEPILIDEALTPDSSRFWPVEGYAPGRAQKSFDKQFLREYLETLVASGAWDKQAPGPELPGEVVEGTLERYERALTLLTA